MIIDFTIQNFRSIKDEQVLSLYVETPKTHLPEHVVYPSKEKIGVLRSVGIYGANASGKSNILLGFYALRHLVCESGDLKDGAAIPCYEPYRLAEANKTAPICFEIEFFNQENVRYVYKISFDEFSIIEESLDFYPSRHKANLFSRSATDTWETISFGGLYKGGIKRMPFFKNNSYLSKAGNNAGASEMIRSIYQYFANNIIHLGPNERMITPDLVENAAMMGKVAQFLCAVDTGISNVEAQIDQNHKDRAFPKEFPSEVAEALNARMKTKFLFSHKAESGEVELFKEKMESEGTRKLFHLLPLLIDVFSEGGIVLMDEIDSSLHPHIAELLIKLFNDPEVNVNNAQLIFSTHNMQLMTPQNLRRDQIWFTQKQQGSTKLYSLDDFEKEKLKSDSPFGHWYDEGRFGALPHIDYLAIATMLAQKKPLLKVAGEQDSGVVHA